MTGDIRLNGLLQVCRHTTVRGSASLPGLAAAGVKWLYLRGRSRGGGSRENVARCPCNLIACLVW